MFFSNLVVTTCLKDDRGQQNTKENARGKSKNLRGIRYRLGTMNVKYCDDLLSNRGGNRLQNLTSEVGLIAENIPPVPEKIGIENIAQFKALSSCRFKLSYQDGG